MIEIESIKAAKEQKDYMDTYAEFIIPCHTPSHTKSMIASQLFSIPKHEILPSPIAGSHTNYRSGLTLSTISSTHEISHLWPPRCTKGKMRAVNSCSHLQSYI